MDPFLDQSLAQRGAKEGRFLDPTKKPKKAPKWTPKWSKMGGPIPWLGGPERLFSVPFSGRSKKGAPGTKRSAQGQKMDPKRTKKNRKKRRPGTGHETEKEKKLVSEEPSFEDDFALFDRMPSAKELTQVKIKVNNYMENRSQI